MKSRQRRATLTALIFILPFFILFTIFTVYPIIQGLWVSVNKWSLMGRQSFVGLANFQKMLKDSKFWASLKHTCIFVVFAAPLIVVISLILAVFANRPTKYKKFLRVSYYLPSILSVSVASFVAKYTFAPYRGLVNGILTWLGACNSTNEPQWFLSTTLSWVVIIVMTLWWTLGFPMLLYLSALQDISKEVMEAAAVDGANSRQQFFRITLPLLKPTISLVTMLQIIACFKVFGQIRMITGGGPANSTRPLIQYIYEQAFDKNNLGYASAMSYVLFIILVVCTLIQLRLQKGDET
jgi:multiple sugar transport system permease protein